MGPNPNPPALKTIQLAGAEANVPVRYWPIWQPGEQDNSVDTVTRSEPWQLGHGEWVVKVVGHSGGVAVSHLAVLPLEERSGPRYFPKQNRR